MQTQYAVSLSPHLFPPALSRRALVAAPGNLASPWVRALASFTSRAITIIVPYTAGGASDIGARMPSTEMGRLLGQGPLRCVGASQSCGVRRNCQPEHG